MSGGLVDHGAHGLPNLLFQAVGGGGPGLQDRISGLRPALPFGSFPQAFTLRLSIAISLSLMPRILETISLVPLISPQLLTVARFTNPEPSAVTA